jgi:hypothetical protein
MEDFLGGQRDRRLDPGLAFARAQLHSSRADRRIDPRRPVQGHGPAVAKA